MDLIFQSKQFKAQMDNAVLAQTSNAVWQPWNRSLRVAKRRWTLARHEVPGPTPTINRPERTADTTDAHFSGVPSGLELSLVAGSSHFVAGECPSAFQAEGPGAKKDLVQNSLCQRAARPRDVQHRDGDRLVGVGADRLSAEQRQREQKKAGIWFHKNFQGSRNGSECTADWAS